MKKKVLLLTAAFAMIIGSATFMGCGESTKTEQVDHEHAGHTHYVCPMDCEEGKTYDEPGTCPVCEMDLEETDS